MSFIMVDNLVSIDWLKENLEHPDLLVLEVIAFSVHELEGGEHISIPGARPFDLRIFRDETSPYPNTFPDVAAFEKECQRLGIKSNAIIIIYDRIGVHFSPRAWWLFKAMGHTTVAVLDGGLPEWIKQKGPLDKGISLETQETRSLGNFKAKFEAVYCKKYEEVLANVTQKDFVIIDARSAPRFEGTEAEPRAGLQSGHIPHSLNLPYTEVLENGKLKTAKKLSIIFAQKGLNGEQALVFSCGSGITACIIMLALNVIYPNNYHLYDGSWTEWAMRQDLKIAKN